MKGRNRVKKPHYVPQGYLRQFAIKDQLFVFDKTLRRQFAANVRDVCSERAFHDLHGFEEVTGNDQSLEQFFHGFEEAGPAAILRVVESIRNRAFTRLSEEDRIDLALFIGLQHLRTKRMRADAGDLMEDLSKQSFIRYLRQRMPNLPDGDSWLSMNANEKARFAAQFYLLTNEDVRVAMSGILNRRWWLFIHNDGDGLFYTSDHPIVQDGDCSSSGQAIAADFASDITTAFTGEGLFRKLLPGLLVNIFAVGLRVICPLAPDVVLVMLDRERYAKGDSVDGKAQRMWSTQDLDYYNALQVSQCHRQVYSRAPEFSLAERLFAQQNPGA